MIRLGIIGLSPGNGHPYSWAAICNGYDSAEMSHCPFPVIPQYLANESWPEAKIPDVKLTHIWTQDRAISEHVAKASLIDHICDKMEDMIGQVDAVLLARDDAEYHLEMSRPFLEAGVPIFIDKPFALSLKQAEQMLAYQKYDYQIFSCSSLRYAKELSLNSEDKKALGQVTYIEARIPKKWETYAVHLIDPIVQNIPDRGSLIRVEKAVHGAIHKALISWTTVQAEIAVCNDYPVDLEFCYYGTQGMIKKVFTHSFQAFKDSIMAFIEGLNSKKIMIAREETLEIVKILELGR